MGEEGSRSFQKKKSKKPSSFRNYTPKTSKEKERWWGWGLCGVLPCPSHCVGEMAKDRPNPAGLLSLALHRNLRAGAEVGDGMLEPPVAPHTPDA